MSGYYNFLVWELSGSMTLVFGVQLYFLSIVTFLYTYIFDNSGSPNNNETLQVIHKIHIAGIV
jgi:hypothetical protein